MNTISQIENALKAINQATFQTLINHLLHLEGYNFLGAPGAVVGKDKTSKGTPDSFFINNDKYIFVECTTQGKLGESKTFFEKLSKDVEHCFEHGKESEKKWRIENDKIEKIILACNEKLTVEEYDLLNKKVKAYNYETQLEILNIQNLPMRIYELPKLAEEYLDIQIVKGDIFLLDDFLSKTTKGLQPSLTNEFLGREIELANSIEALKKYDILLLSGGSGVGKSKLGVKILEEFKKERMIPIVIQSSGVSLWDDFKHLFHPGKQHVILFDDANKSIANLGYLLNKIDSSQNFSVKVIITSRDYVKKQVALLLDNYSYKEINISEFKDDEITKIILSVLPDLQYHFEIRRKITELAKGNARVALMATYSVTPDSEINYLSSPVLLYEKYFQKISNEINIFQDSIILKSLAIVSFFGVLDRKNEELRLIIEAEFGIDWSDLWTSIIDLHNNEILDLYQNEIVKVSDQVLATYSFYKCFIDEGSAVINYGKWIACFVEKFSSRIRATLIDTNNTFEYAHVKNIVIPHLNNVLTDVKSDEKLYAFYGLFWFYKGRECLLFLKNWIEGLSKEQILDSVEFEYVHNNHTVASKYFELLKGFWIHSNELLKPSIELTLKLLVKQPSRLPEVLKFINDEFKYKIGDIDGGYFRQKILLDVLFDDKLELDNRFFAVGIFINIAEQLLGWHHTDFGSGKGRTLTLYNFDLHKSDELMALRKRILYGVLILDIENKRLQRILNQVVYPGGKMDTSIYLEELYIYNELIDKKLDKRQYTHCEFVSVLANNLIEAGMEYPQSWDEFIESDIRKLSKFLKTGSEDDNHEEIDIFIKENTWESIKTLLISINGFYKQQNRDSEWYIESGISCIYISLSRKNKIEFERALRLVFSGELEFPMGGQMIKVALQENHILGHELLDIIGDYDFKEKSYWISVLLAMLPTEQVDRSFLLVLISTFENLESDIFILKMLNYLKFESVFEEYKIETPELVEHNIITYLTSIRLKGGYKGRRDFGFHFCVECGMYFFKQVQLLKDAYWIQHKMEPHFDHDGMELKAVLDLDRRFINDSLITGVIGIGYSLNVKLENINPSVLWEYEDSEELIEELLLIILNKEEFTFIANRDINSIFGKRYIKADLIPKMKLFILNLTSKYSTNEKMLLVLAEIVYDNFIDWFIEYYEQFLKANSSIELTKQILFGRSACTSSSWVPVYQKKIDFYREIIKMLNSSANILDYSEHIDYFEEKIVWKKKDIEREQKRDFMNEFYL